MSVIKITQARAEFLRQGTLQNARVTQMAVEVIMQPLGTQNMRVTQVAIEFPVPGPNSNPNGPGGPGTAQYRIKAPIMQKIQGKDGKPTLAWSAFFEEYGDVPAFGPVICDTQSARLNTDPNTPPYYSPGRFLRYLYYEVDTGHLYIAALSLAGQPGWTLIL